MDTKEVVPMLHVPANIKVLIVKIVNYPSTAFWPRCRYAKSNVVYPKIWRSAFGMLLACSYCSASIILVRLSSDAIYIAADGRITGMDDSGKETFADTCKVRKIGQFVVADTGIIGAPMDLVSTFDVWSQLKSIKASSVADFAKQAASLLPSRYQAVFTERSRRIGRPFQQFIPGDIGVAAFEDGKPAFIRIIFVIMVSSLLPEKMTAL